MGEVVRWGEEKWGCGRRGEGWLGDEALSDIGLFSISKAKFFNLPEDRVVGTWFGLIGEEDGRLVRLIFRHLPNQNHIQADTALQSAGDKTGMRFGCG